LVQRVLFQGQGTAGSRLGLDKLAKELRDYKVRQDQLQTVPVGDDDDEEEDDRGMAGKEPIPLFIHSNSRGLNLSATSRHIFVFASSCMRLGLCFALLRVNAFFASNTQSGSGSVNPTPSHPGGVNQQA
jgi:hypothetical protein